MKNLILNGTFDSGAAHWSGRDIEANHTENAYLHNGSKNRVAEIDGHRGRITVMKQSFEVDRPVEARLTLDAALRNAALPDRGIDGFKIEVRDDQGQVIAALTVLPTSNSWTEVALDVPFPSAGTYTLSFTEIGDNDSLGAIVDNIKMMVCFANGTLIETSEGPKRIETLVAGDLIVTERGLKPLRWVFERALSAADLRKEPKLRPVEIAAGALGGGLPTQPLRVSRQHRMVAQSKLTKRMFGTSEILLPAIRLTTLPGISVCEEDTALSYFHLLFDDHEIVRANGAPSESFLVTARSFDALSEAAQDELRLLFPDMIETRAQSEAPARPVPEPKRQKRFMARLTANGRKLLEAA
ncbi:Hint domain-containing protein [Shimia sp. MMG029]|uniref:Hint domain-containing protein n=1 Tax=Shimia sp. MMG029 TaxID=3021978 RepID=UPI0022FDC338|nr:Hint domain-containing protein [Shimia sp. MMG029]MDA5558554.1 Hint domain-containing protein [Shimia sp. MMG029]